MLINFFSILIPFGINLLQLVCSSKLPNRIKVEADFFQHKKHNEDDQ